MSPSRQGARSQAVEPPTSPKWPADLQDYKDTNIAQQIIDLYTTVRPDDRDHLLKLPLPGREYKFWSADGGGHKVLPITRDAELDTRNILPSGRRPKRARDTASDQTSNPAKKRKTVTPNPEFTRFTRGAKKQLEASTGTVDTAPADRASPPAQQFPPRDNITAPQRGTRSTRSSANILETPSEPNNALDTQPDPANVTTQRSTRNTRSAANTPETQISPTKVTERIDSPMLETDTPATNLSLAMASPIMSPRSVTAGVSANATEAVTTHTPALPTVHTRRASAGIGKSTPRRKSKATSTSFSGTSTGVGTCSETPPDATLTTPWHCANVNCNTGHTWQQRDGAQKDIFSKKVISNFFGRNKKETSLIDADVWHNWCRKDYQRTKYRLDKGPADAWCKHYIQNIADQLVRLKIWRPEAKFKIQLSKGAKERLSKYYKELNKNGGDEAAAEAAVSKTAGKGKSKKGTVVPLSLEDAFPIKLLDHISNTFTIEDHTADYDDVKGVIKWLKARVEAGEVETMPPVEFLINKQGEGETTTDPSENYFRWIAHINGMPYTDLDTITSTLAAATGTMAAAAESDHDEDMAGDGDETDE